MSLLIMETDVVISNQYDQFCVSGVPEHPMEAAHVVLPVLQTPRDKTTQTQAGFSTGRANKTTPRPGRLVGEREGSLRVTSASPL